MLTAIRELAEEAERRAATLRAPRLVARGDDCVARTPEHAPVLREAGVVDAGAAGLVEIVRGIAAASPASRCPSAAGERAALALDAIHQELSRYRYCTVFVVEGEGLDADALERGARAARRLAARRRRRDRAEGARAHRRPGRALVARRRARHARAASRSRTCTRRRPSARSACCAPCRRRGGVRASSRSSRARATAGSSRASARGVVDGGRTMNPSTAELVAAIEATGAEEVDRAAEQLERHHRRRAGRARTPSKPVRVVPTVSLQAGLAAIVAFDAARDRAGERGGDGGGGRGGRDRRGHGRLARRRARTASRCARAPTSASPTASRSRAATSFDEVARAVVERLLAEPRGVLTLLTGEDAAAARRAARASSRRASRARARGARGRPAALPAAALRRVAA